MQGLIFESNDKRFVIIRVERYTHHLFDICLLGRICKEGEVDRSTSEWSVSSSQGHRFERTYWFLALATPLSRSLTFAVAIIAVVLFVLTLAIAVVLVLIGIPVALHLRCRWCRLLTT